MSLKPDGPVRGTAYPCKLLGAPDGAPRSVFLKRWKREAGAGPFNPLDSDPRGPSCRLFNDWAGLQFLQALFPRELVAPEWLGGDRSLGFFVSGKVGEASLTEVLHGMDPGAAERGLLALGKLLGQMQAASFERQKDYEALRSALGPIAHRQDTRGTGPWLREALKDIRTNLARIGFQPEERLFKDLEGVAAALEADLFQVFTHHDLHPENLRFCAGRPYLLDFELSAFRHAMTDGAFVRMLFPGCWRVYRVPREVLSRMEAEYRTALSEGCSAARDDDLYQQALLDGCSYWLAVGLRFALSPPRGHLDRTSALDRDKRWGETSLRRILHERLGAFLEASAGARTHAGVRDTCLRLQSHLARTWDLSGDRVPLFPAFRSVPAGPVQAHS